MFSSQSFSSASVTGRQRYQGIRRVSRTKCVPVKIVCGADVSAATPFWSSTEYLRLNLAAQLYTLDNNKWMNPLQDVRLGPDGTPCEITYRVVLWEYVGRAPSVFDCP